MAELFDITIPVLHTGLAKLKAILEKAEEYASSSDFNSDVLVEYRLFPNMLPFKRQVQIVSDTAKGCAARLSCEVAPSYEDSESSIKELLERLAKTIDYLAGFKAEQINGKEDASIELKLPKGSRSFDGLSYVNGFVLPNFYFHMTMAYAILRHCGVPLGKQDFLGKS